MLATLSDAVARRASSYSLPITPPAGLAGVQGSLREPPRGIQAGHAGYPRRLMGRTRTTALSGFSYRWAAATFAGVEAELIGEQPGELISSAVTARGVPSDGPG